LEKIPGKLYEVLIKLELNDLNDVFIAGGMELLKSLGAENLVKVLTKLDTYSLSGVLNAEGHGALKFHNDKAKDGELQHLVAVLTKLTFGGLDTVLKARKEMGILSSLGAEGLVKVLSGFELAMLGRSTALRSLLTNEKNGILAFLNKESKHLIEVLSKLTVADLKKVLIAGGEGLLNSLGAVRLVALLSKFASADLGTLLANKGNGVLDFLLKNPEQLAEVLARLNPADLSALLIGNGNGILEFLLKTPDQLVALLAKFGPKNLYNLFEAEENKVFKIFFEKNPDLLGELLFRLESADLLNLFKGNGLAAFLLKDPVKLISMLSKLESSKLRDLLMDKDNGILIFLLANSAQLVTVLFKLNLADLKAVLETDVNGKKCMCT
jgi:hypothetical protein